MKTQTEQFDRYTRFFLAGIAVLIIIGGFWQVHSSLFAYRNNILAQAQQEIERRLAAAGIDADSLANTSEAARIQELQQKDTDNDGLNDFEEQYVYGTSAYLADSDSDGKTDQEEITAGTDPNCAEGQQCAPSHSSTASTQTQISAAALEAFSDLAPDQAQSNSQQQQQLQQLSSDPQALREFLKGQGLSEEVLNSADDATLIQIAQEAIAVSQTNTAETNPAIAIQQQAEVIRQYTPQQKRDLLIQSGVSASEVNKMSDDEVNNAVSGALDQALKAYLDPLGLTGNSNVNSNNSNTGNSNRNNSGRN